MAKDENEESLIREELLGVTNIRMITGNCSVLL